MNTNQQLQIRKATPYEREAIVALLKANQLPVDDLPSSPDHFLVATDKETVIGTIGLETNGTYGLLRSMAVDNDYRNRGIASLLVAELESYARSIGIENMYLLTETAAAYFERKQYRRITREVVPAALHLSSEFRHVCPASAIVMTKPINDQ